MLLVHAGRKTGKPHEAVAMVLGYDRTGEAVICSGWGETDWIRNIRAHPALRVQLGRLSFVPDQRFLTEGEAFAVALEFLRRHPWRVRLASRVFGWDLGSDAAVRDFVRSHPFVALRPATSP